MAFSYKYGLNPGHVPVGLGTLDTYAAGALPKGPPSIAVPRPPVGMLGNDDYGDCGVAGLEEGFACTAAITHETNLTFPTAQMAITYYLKYTGGQDSGVVLADYLAYVRQHTFFGQQIKAYAPVSISDIPTLQTAVWLYGFAYTGITVYSGMEQAFQANETDCVWDSTILDSPVGGHCVPIVAYDDLYLYVMTWAQVVRVTYSCWHAIASEAWAAITGEVAARHGDGRGVSITTLTNVLDRLGA